MVTARVGDLFASEAQTLVNTVNCVGVMGAGVALEFKKRFRAMHQDYIQRCERGQVRLGEPYIFKDLVGPWVLNFPTKHHWRSVSNLADIVRGLEYLKRHYQEWGITSMAVPPLGCGQGGLEWAVVGPTLYRHLSEIDIPVELFAPLDAPPEQATVAFLRGAVTGLETPRLQPAWVALGEIVNRINSQRYHWPVGRVILQKIAYFGTTAELPTGLTFGRGSYGPFAPSLRRVTTALVNNGVLKEAMLGKGFVYSAGPTFPQAIQAVEADLEEWTDAIDRVADLFLRLNTRQSEVAATVHFAATELGRGEGRTVSEVDVLESVRLWKQDRKPAIRDEEVGASIRGLNTLGWIKVQASPSLPLPPGALADV